MGTAPAPHHLLTVPSEAQPAWSTQGDAGRQEPPLFDESPSKSTMAMPGVCKLYHSWYSPPWAFSVTYSEGMGRLQLSVLTARGCCSHAAPPPRCAWG